MVNHTIHTCEQRVRFPLSAIVIFITILPLYYHYSLFYTTHTQTYPYLFTRPKQKNHITISLYNISVSILHSLLQKPKLYLHLLLPYSLLLLTKYIYTILPITHHYYYIYTNLQSKYTTILDRYISYILHTQLLPTYLH